MSGRRKNSGEAIRGVRMIGHWVPGTFSGLDKLATGLRRSRLGRKVVELLAKVGRCGQRAAAGAHKPLQGAIVELGGLHVARRGRHAGRGSGGAGHPWE